MIDLHTHILPAMDDGSETPTETLKLLELCAAQQMEAVVATPHFNLRKESAPAFLTRRQAAMAQVQELSAGKNLPHVLPGAEVRYVPELGQCPHLPALCLGESNALLLELPLSPWDRQLLDAVYDFSFTSGLTVIIAHVERYFPLQTRANVEKLFKMGTLMQADADFVLHRATRGKALRMLRKNQIHFLCSDCHGVADRPPNLAAALAVVSDRLGPETVRRLEKRTVALLCGQEKL